MEEFVSVWVPYDSVVLFVIHQRSCTWKGHGGAVERKRAIQLRI